MDIDQVINFLQQLDLDFENRLAVETVVEILLDYRANIQNTELYDDYSEGF